LQLTAVSWALSNNVADADTDLLYQRSCSSAFWRAGVATPELNVQWTSITGFSIAFSLLPGVVTEDVFEDMMRLFTQ